MHCSSKNLLYVITCQGCHENYTGQTGNELRKNMKVHRQQIEDPSTRNIPLSEHLRIVLILRTNNFLYYHSINSQITQQNNTDS